MTKRLTILQLYPKNMNMYGDYGNILALQTRAKKHGYDTKLTKYDLGDSELPEADIIVGGGGQDSGQIKIKDDLQGIGELLSNRVRDGVPMLMVCGLYQLFGKHFTTQTGKKIPGLGIFDMETYASKERLVGNIIIENPRFGEIIGFENHSGKTYLGESLTPLGYLIKGAGNNGHDESEGATYNNTIGTYIHGPILPKNPNITDFLLEQAAVRKYGKFEKAEINDNLIKKARLSAKKRPR